MRSWIFVSVSFILGILGGYFLGARFSPSVQMRTDKAAALKLSETRQTTGYKFISPLLECDNFAPSDLASHASLKAKLNQYVASSKSTGELTHISVYYRDLNNGPWIGLNEHEAFSPASMLKVPIMLAVLKLSESEQGLLKKKYEVIPADVDDFAPNIDDEMIKVGQQHTVRELIERMIVYSDNTAKNLLLRILEGSSINKQLWTSLGMNEPNASTPSDFLSVKDYSAFFRILYNATYLSKENSELALELLSSTRFKSGIRAGIQNRAVVSSKFGERGLIDSNAKQLHDCGIVYDGNSPYLLCIMTKGTDWERQATVIQEISKLVFENRK